MPARKSDYSGRSLPLRLVVVCCIVFGLLASHVVMRYLHISLFGYVHYRGLDPVIPWVVLGVYLVTLVVLAGMAVRRWSSAGLAVGTGLLLFTVEPFTILNGGCEVGSAAATHPTIPHMTVDGVAVIVHSWKGSCAAYLNGLVIATGLSSVAGGLWFDSVPDTAFDRWLGFVERYWPRRATE